MGAKPESPSRSEAWAVPLGLVGGAAVGLLLGVLVGAVAAGITLGAALGLVAGAIAAVGARPGVLESRPVVRWVTLPILVVGGLAVVLLWLR